MISAAPPTTPPSAGGGGIKIPIYRDFSVPAPVGLTDGLTAPRVWSLYLPHIKPYNVPNKIRLQIQRRNDYVSLNSRPKSSASSSLGSRPVSLASEAAAAGPQTPLEQQQVQRSGSRPVSTLSSATQSSTGYVCQLYINDMEMAWYAG